MAYPLLFNKDLSLYLLIYDIVKLIIDNRQFKFEYMNYENFVKL